MALSITMIAAMDSKRGIGKAGGIPWKFPEDMQHFKRETMGLPCIMGRKTFISLGRLLPGRHHIVLSKENPDVWLPGWARGGDYLDLPLSTVRSHIDAIHVAVDRGWTQAMVIGGAEVYRAYMPLADRLLLTTVPGDFGCDVFFPEMFTGWRMSADEDAKPGNPNLHGARFQTWVRG